MYQSMVAKAEARIQLDSRTYQVSLTKGTVLEEEIKIFSCWCYNDDGPFRDTIRHHLMFQSVM